MSEPKNQRWYFSPVDYEAWGRGYMPPSEHILIHELSTAPNIRVVMSSSTDKHGVWLVVKGGTLPRNARNALYRQIIEAFDLLEESEKNSGGDEISSDPPTKESAEE